MFFGEHINFKKFYYLRRCVVIPVQSFGSHIHPQPSRLGLNCLYENTEAADSFLKKLQKTVNPAAFKKPQD
jgi:hypothetical protein